jgi:hypothetical protein
MDHTSGDDDLDLRVKSNKGTYSVRCFTFSLCQSFLSAKRSGNFCKLLSCSFSRSSRDILVKNNTETSEEEKEKKKRRRD